jgi:hypothetical protein
MGMTPTSVRLFDLGLRLFPILPRSKKPACGSWDDYRCTRAQAATFTNYGVCLTNSLGVVDTDTPDAEAWAAAHLPDTPFKVRTARGIHRYYRIVGPVASFIYRDGQKMEFRKQGQYVVGPGSIHPGDAKRGIPPGIVYTATDWSWQLDDLSIFPRDFVFDDRQPTLGEVIGVPSEIGSARYVFPEVVVEPGRHHELFKLLRQSKGKGWDKEDTWEVVTLANQRRCKPPLAEDADFRGWFERSWANPDRPFAPAGAIGLRELGGLRGL